MSEGAAMDNRASVTEQRREGASKRRIAWIMVVLTALGTGIALLALSVSISSADRAPRATIDSPLGVTQTWKTTNKGCGIEFAAMSGAEPTPGTADPVNSVSGRKVDYGLWGSGILKLTLTAEGESSYTVQNVRLVDVADASNTPEWYYYRNYGGCGGAGDKAVHLRADLDGGLLSPLGGTSSASLKSASLFQATSVTKDATLDFEISVAACKKSRTFKVDIDYQKAGSSEMQTRPVGPFTLWAADASRPVYSGETDGTVIQGTWQHAMSLNPCA